MTGSTMYSEAFYLIVILFCYPRHGKCVFANGILQHDNECPTVHVPHALVNPATSVSHGTTVTIECQSPFTLIGNPTPTCHNSTFTDIPSCENTDVFDITGMQIMNKSRVHITLASDHFYLFGRRVSWITGSAFLPDGRLILCDNYNYKIKLLNRNFDIQETLNYSYRGYNGLPRIFDVAVMNDTFVVITLPDKYQIQYIQLNEAVPMLQREKFVNVERDCYGIDIFNNTIYLACDGPQIRMLDMNGHLKNTFTAMLDYGLYLYIAVSRLSGNLYLSSRDVYCLSPDGSILFHYNTNSSLFGPSGVLVDDLDNPVVGYFKTVEVIKNSDHTYRTLLNTTHDGLINPIYSLAYRRTDKTLVIGLGWTSWLQVVKLSD